MDKNKSLLAVSVVLVVLFIMIGFSGLIQGEDKSYEIKPEITLPEYRTNAARAIDAYERVMDRFIDMSEKNLASINTDVKSISKKLILIDRKLTTISTRIARMEKVLGIERAEKQFEKTTDVTNTNKPGLKKRK